MDGYEVIETEGGTSNVSVEGVRDTEDGDSRRRGRS